MGVICGSHHSPRCGSTVFAKNESDAEEKKYHRQDKLYLNGMELPSGIKMLPVHIAEQKSGKNKNESDHKSVSCCPCRLLMPKEKRDPSGQGTVPRIPVPRGCESKWDERRRAQFEYEPSAPFSPWRRNQHLIRYLRRQIPTGMLVLLNRIGG
jgi:hypothetical protein